MAMVNLLSPRSSSAETAPQVTGHTPRHIAGDRPRRPIWCPIRSVGSQARRHHRPWAVVVISDAQWSWYVRVIDSCTSFVQSIIRNRRFQALLIVNETIKKNRLLDNEVKTKNRWKRKIVFYRFGVIFDSLFFFIVSICTFGCHNLRRWINKTMIDLKKIRNYIPSFWLNLSVDTFDVYSISTCWFLFVLYLDSHHYIFAPCYCL